MRGIGSGGVRVAAALAALAGVLLLSALFLRDPFPDVGARAFTVPDGAGPVPMRLVRGVHPVVRAEVEGRTLNLLVDTGAPVTMLPPSLADGARDRGVSRLCLENGICAEDLAVYFGPTNYSQDGENTYNGILGADILTRFAVTFDYGARTLTFGETAPAPAITVPFNVDDKRKARVTVVVGGQSFDGVLLDTGASYTRLKPEMVKALGSGREGARSEIGYYITREAETEVFRMERFCLSGACASSIPVQAGDWAAVGGTFFRQFRVSFDYMAGRLGLTPVSGPVPVNALDRRGLQVDIRDPAAIVMVLPGSEAAQAGIAAGDRIEAIDGEAVEVLGYFGVNERLEAEQRVALILEDGREVTVGRDR